MTFTHQKSQFLANLWLVVVCLIYVWEIGSFLPKKLKVWSQSQVYGVLSWGVWKGGKKARLAYLDQNKIFVDRFST
jgi:hypothetical protein